MPLSKQHKQHSRERILECAYRLFSRVGYDQVTIDLLMREAGLTRGAFYAHFANKSELYAAAIQHAAKLHTACDPGPQVEDRAWLKKAVENYLSRQHVREQASPCPLAFLANDVAIREPSIRASYSEVYRQLVEQIHGRMGFLTGEKRARFARALTAMLIGSVALGRALDSDTEMHQLLQSCQETMFETLDRVTP